MDNYAVVVGIDRYANQEWNLSSAVDDALAFASWAIREGGVQPKNLKLLLAPLGALKNAVQIPNANLPPVPVAAATSDNLRHLLFDEFEDKGFGKGADRLYFYFAGHGCSHPEVRDQRSAEPVLILSDVERVRRDSGRLCTFSEILAGLRSCGPLEQLFLLDACRDFGLAGLGGAAGAATHRYLRPLALRSGGRASSQFVVYATSPGQQAAEAGRGVFGAELLRALKGDPAAVTRVAGIGDYELRLEDLYRFVRAQVKKRVANLANFAEFVQLPERDPEPSVPNPLLRSFREAEIPEVPLIVRMNPGEARKSGKVTVFYETIVRAGPEGPPLPRSVEFRLKPSHYAVAVDAENFRAERKAVKVPLGMPLDFTLTAGPASAPSVEDWLCFGTDDRKTSIKVTGPGGEKRTGLGSVCFDPALTGIYQVRVATPEGEAEDQAFDYPDCGSDVHVKPPTQQLEPQQLKSLRAANIRTDGAYIEASESLGPMANMKMTSLLGFAAYATYTMPEEHMSRLRAFALKEIPEDGRSQAWITVLLSVAGRGPKELRDRLAESKVTFFCADQEAHEGGFHPLRGLSAFQFLSRVSEGAAIIELRVPDLPVTSFAMAGLSGRVGVVSVGVRDDGSFDTQLYLIPFRHSELEPEALRTVEQAQRFYSSGEPVPDELIDEFLTLKALDPLLGALAGYTMVRRGEAAEFRGKPVQDLAPGEWNRDSPMQNMLRHFGGLPDSHVLAGLSDPGRRREHFDRALEQGIPLFSEGLQALLSYYGEKSDDIPAALRRAWRTLATGSAFSAWVSWEPALPIHEGTFGTPPFVWSVLEDERPEIESNLRAVGCLTRTEPEETKAVGTGFLVAPNIVLTASHVATEIERTIDASSRAQFVLADDPASPDILEMPVVQVVALSEAARLGLLRLEAPIPNVPPLKLARTDDAIQRGDPVYLIGYPFPDKRVRRDVVAHVFGHRLGVKRMQPGYVLAAPEGERNFDHDASTLGGNAGSPVISLDGGFVLGVHWGSMDEAGFKRGRAAALWKDVSREFLADAGLV